MTDYVQLFLRLTEIKRTGKMNKGYYGEIPDTMGEKDAKKNSQKI